MNGEPIRSRKADHIEICLKENVSQDHCYWNDVHLIHDAMPEIDMEDVDTSTYVLGTRLSFPFIVTAITGGFSGAKKINANIAEACAELGVGMGVGSERAGVAGVEPESYSVVSPALPLPGLAPVHRLCGLGLDECVEVSQRNQPSQFLCLDFHTEFLVDQDHDVHDVQTVDAQPFFQRGVFLKQSGFDLKFVNQKIVDLDDDIFSVHNCVDCHFLRHTMMLCPCPISSWIRSTSRPAFRISRVRSSE